MARKVAVKRVKRRILAVVEGKVTEPQYLKRLHRDHRDSVDLVVKQKHTDPLGIVEYAKRTVREEGGRNVFDEVWLVFDQDEHPEVERACTEGLAAGYLLAFSNPCIELWFLLHFEDQTAWIDRHAAQRESETHLGCLKALTSDALSVLIARYEIAKAHAHALTERHIGDGSSARANPSSTMWSLAESIKRRPLEQEVGD